MTQAIAARREGDVFQARLFWHRAITMLQPESSIVRVGFESGPRGFDDIWSEFCVGKGPKDPRAVELSRSHIQCKYHVTHGTYTHADLTDPEFINAQSISLLQRAYEAQLKYAPTGSGARFSFITNWFPMQSDKLSQLIRRSHGGLDLNALFDGSTDRSAVGKLRKLWRDHLGIDDDQLQVLARTMAFYSIGQSLFELREQLNSLFPSVGLRQIPSSSLTFVYDDLPFQWLTAGRLEFDQNDLIQACKSEGLLAGPAKSFISFGVKSFEHPFDHLEDRCNEVLNLVPQFDERAIRSDSDWVDTLYPRLHGFLLGAAKTSAHLRLALDIHSTLAFAAGSILDVKSGRQIEIEQRNHGYEIWSRNDQASSPNWPTWKFESTQSANASEDLAVVVSATHNIEQAVRAYMTQALPNVTRVLTALPNTGASNALVACGQHAYQLAETLSAEIRKIRPAGGCIHLFVASPNVLTFFIGQRQASLGRLVLYEFDFEGLHGGSYTKSLSLPISIVNETGA